VERLNPINPDQYEFLGEWEEMTIMEESIQVKGQDEPETLVVRFTRHGPVMTPVLEGVEQVLALRWTALDGGQLLRSFYMLDHASNWEEFREALRYFQAPAQNLVYADVEGNIGYQMPGDIPIRAKGEGLVPVPGWTGEYEWTGYIPFEELPSTLNPPAHYIVTANHKVVSDDYPYFISHEWAEPFRAQRITDLLEANDELTVDDFRSIQADAYSAPAAALTPDLLRVGAQDWRQERAFALLRDWDYQLASSSPAAAVSEVLLWRLMDNTFGDELEDAGISESSFLGFASSLMGIIDDPDNLWFDDASTREVETRDDIIRQSAAETVDFWGRRFGDQPRDWAWGKVHFAEFEHSLGSVWPLHLILNRGPVPARGSAETVDAAGYTRGVFSIRVLASQRQIVDIGEWGGSLSQHTTGQSGQPFHKHYADMIKPWQQVDPHPMWFERDSIRANMEGLLILEPG
jgi:penicillin amidase